MSNLFRLKVCGARTALDLLPFPPLQCFLTNPEKLFLFTKYHISLFLSSFPLGAFSNPWIKTPLLLFCPWVEFGKDSFKMVFISEA